MTYSLTQILQAELLNLQRNGAAPTLELTAEGDQN